MFQVAFIYLGLDANSHRPEDLAATEALFTRVRPYVRYPHSSQYVDDLASGEVCVSVAWSGGITNTVGQANGNAASLPYVAEVIRNDPPIYPSEEVFRRLTIDRSWSLEQMREVNRAWARVKAAR